ncbi:unnamed protein product [Rhizophagus irregularis]|uniref:Ion transport domain-containing protein n=1 Tax=Rhizophagus irregularis TaxID=588596 RepID=A0A915YWV4_9GLOM|nr:unnamed protein product [Rhizophagus irregularis]
MHLSKIILFAFVTNKLLKKKNIFVDNEIRVHVDNPHNLRDSKNAHNGKRVSLVSLSPNGKYVVTYSEDDKSIEGWIVRDSKLNLDPETNVYELPRSDYIHEIILNDSKTVCFGYNYNYLHRVEIFQMSNEHQQIKLNPPPKMSSPSINFRKNGDLILSHGSEISIYHSKHDKMSNELSLVSSYKLSNYTNEVFIDDDNIWIISQNYLFHWDLKTFQLKFSYSLGFTTGYYDVSLIVFTVITKGNLIAVKYINHHNEINEIAIFIKNVHSPIRNIQSKNSDMKIELCQVQNNVYLLAFNIPKKDENQDIILYSITDINKQQPIDASKIFNDEDSENKFILYEYNSESKEAFGLVDGKFSYINLSDLNLHGFFESHKEDDDLVGWNDYLGQTFKYYYNDTLAFPDMENIKSLSFESCNDMEKIRSLFSEEYENINFNNQKYKWRMELKNDKLDKLSVYSDKEEFLCSKDLGIEFTTFNWKILNNNALALRLDYNKFIVIYEYDIHNKRIKTQYFIFKGEGQIDFSGPILPMIDTKDIAILKEFYYKQYFTQLSEDPFNEGIKNYYYSHFHTFSHEAEIRKMQSKQQIVLIVPYIDYSRYPLEYSFWKEIFYPQSSVFTDTCIKEFYSNWNDPLSAQNPNDPNNPWTLSNTYNQVDENGNILNETLIQVPSENTNLFYSYPTSLLAIYLFLTGNQNSLSPWAPKPTTENTILFVLMAVFSFLIVIYLMNLFIGLLNIAIDEDNDRASYLVQKAEVIAEIELFYLFPHQRRWRTWFPEVIYYCVDVKKAQKYIKEAIKNGEWKKDDWSDKILKLLSIEDAIKD